MFLIFEGVVQYEAVIEHKDTMQDTEMLLEQVNVHLHGNNLIENLKLTLLFYRSIIFWLAADLQSMLPSFSLSLWLLASELEELYPLLVVYNLFYNFV